MITSKHAFTKLKFVRLPLKQNERVLSSQALNVGRSLGVSSNMAKFTFDSDVWGCHARLAFVLNKEGSEILVNCRQPLQNTAKYKAKQT